VNAEVDKIVTKISGALPALRKPQLIMLEKIVDVFRGTSHYKIHRDGSDIINAEVLQDFGDCLRIHHCFSREPFTKDKFEYALDLCLRSNGVASKLSPRGHRGYDIEIAGVRSSLKTQADKSIKESEIYISKFMELGSGNWTDDPKDLEGLRDQFLEHMEDYERVFTLRALKRGPTEFLYELVEIPKQLLREAQQGEFEMCSNSKQMPKPGYCFVKDNKGSTKFELYFDGGTERKLQIKHLNKSLCKVHARWQFPGVSSAEETEEEKILELDL
jgi:Type II site-specific deoxyribonuclease